MSGATGAGSPAGIPAGNSTGATQGGGGRGSAAQMTDPSMTDSSTTDPSTTDSKMTDLQMTDPHTTNLQAIKPAKADSHAPDTHGSRAQGSQGGTVTDTRGPQTQQYAASGGGSAAPAQSAAAAGAAATATQNASPLPGERQQQQTETPYHPPQAYSTQGGQSAQTQGGQATQAQGAGVRRPRTGARTTPRVRKARLRVAKADPWSVMKVSFLLSIALGICTIVAAAVLWMVMDAMGVFSTVGGTISEATGSNESNGFDLQSFLSLPNVLMFTSIIAVIDVILATALATLGAFIYNLSAGFVGGVELTLAEDE